MKTYILKLRASTSSAYYLYDGDTQVSDTDLATLFTTAGEAYFQFDFDSKTPGSYSTICVVDSQNVTVMTKVDGFTAAEGKNFKGTWGDSATSFTSFVQLSAYGLDESQLGQLASLAKSGKIKTLTTADYNYHYTGDTDDALGPWLLDSGYYITEPGLKIFNSAGGVYTTSPNSVIIIVSKRSDWSQVKYLMASGSVWNLWSTDLTGGSASKTILDVVDSLTGAGASGPYVALSANQGKVLKDLIDSLIIKASGAPTTSTVGTVGMLYEDTTNGKLYQCTDATDPYVWAEVGGGGGGIPTNATFWGASYDAVNNKVGDGDNIAIGTNAYTVFNKNTQVVVGSGARSTAGNGTVVIGAGATASNDMLVVVGKGATTGATWAVTVGANSSATNGASYGVALGAYSVANRNYEVSIGSGSSGQNYATRYLANVRDPSLPQDAATKNYVDHSHTITTSAPDSTTVGILGQLYTDTTGMHTYQCTAIDDTDPDNPVYTWTQRW